MEPVGVVLDTAALLAYASGSSRVGAVLVEIADRGESVLIPATCLAAAYRDVSNNGSDLLDVIAVLDHVVVAPLERGHCAVLGGWARTLGLDTAQVAVEAATHGVVPVLTNQRDLLIKFLPSEWPMLDI